MILYMSLENVVVAPELSLAPLSYLNKFLVYFAEKCKKVILTDYKSNKLVKKQYKTVKETYGLRESYETFINMVSKNLIVTWEEEMHYYRFGVDETVKMKNGTPLITVVKVLEYGVSNVTPVPIFRKTLYRMAGNVRSLWLSFMSSSPIFKREVGYEM